MKTDIKTIAEGLKYMQSKLSGTFVIQYVKYDKKWQFAPSTSAKSEKIKCKSFEKMIKKGHDYMAKKFKKKYGYSYKEDFGKEERIKELENKVKELTKMIGKKERSIDKPKGGLDLYNETFKSSKRKVSKNSRKADVHKEMFKSFKDIKIHHANDSLFNDSITVKSIEDIEKWKEYDLEDYKTQYTNAYQRIAYRKRTNKK